MHASSLNRTSCGKALKLGLCLMASAAALMALPGVARAQATGIACTEAGPNPVFTLDPKSGYIQLPDGSTAFMWSYAKGGSGFQSPGPVLCVHQGDTVTVVLNNTLPEPVSIMFPGQEGVTANGAPAQPQFDGTGALTSLTDAAPSNGSVTYSFLASNPGSYLYESGTNPKVQVRMGLFGALIVRPSTSPEVGTSAGAPESYMYNRADSRFTTGTPFANGGPALNEEYMVLLSEIDPYLNAYVEQGVADLFDFDHYLPRYRLINGRGFPDSISDNFTPFLPEQPYGALARIHPKDASHPYPGAIRYLNVGTEEFPYHPHGNNGRVIGRDGRPLAGPNGEDLSMEKFAINIGPGQTWDVIFDWVDAEGYKNDLTNPRATVDGKPNPDFKGIPVFPPQVNNQEFGAFYSGSPYLGVQGTLPPGASTLNTCGEYYIISHNHALFQMSSWGVNATGPITYVRVDPPLPNNCQ